MFIAGNTGILNIFLNAGTNNTISISPADTAVASISLLLLNIPVLNIDFLLFLILNTCTNSESAKTVNAIACPISTLTSSADNVLTICKYVEGVKVYENFNIVK